LLAFLLLGALVLAACGSPSSSAAPQPTREARPVAFEEPDEPWREAEPPAPPTPEPTPEPVYEAAVQSMSLPSIGVRGAPLVPMGVRNGYMDLPYNPYSIAWYHFTGKPGTGGNAVFSAHLDYINYGPAVFSRLYALEGGDPVSVQLADGTRLDYEVTTNETVPLAALDMQEVLEHTPEETLTLITCAGAFNGYDYSHRVVVRAERKGVETPRGGG
jgi:LPXTG-site transpeptidase (sortase) family protein